VDYNIHNDTADTVASWIDTLLAKQKKPLHAAFIQNMGYSYQPPTFPLIQKSTLLVTQLCI
jgi:hypothetical protein